MLPSPLSTGFLENAFEERLGGIMLIRLELTDLVERLKQEEHALATTLKTVLQQRDVERAAFRKQLDEVQSYANGLEAQLKLEREGRGSDLAAAGSAREQSPASAQPEVGGHVAACARQASCASGPWSGAAELTLMGAVPHTRVADGGCADGVVGPLRDAVQAFSHTTGAVGGAIGTLPGVPLSTLPSGGPTTWGSVTPTGPAPAGGESAHASAQPSSGAQSAHASGGAQSGARELQRRLAQERSQMVRAAAPVQVPLSALPLSAALPHRRPPEGPSACVDPFDHFEHGGMRVAQPLRSEAKRKPSNPAVVTAEGATFQFSHT